MNNFTIEIQKGGKWEPIDAVAVFPFNFADLLDERLDEAYITLINSKTKNYPCLAQIRAILKQDGTVVDTVYFIVARDDGNEYPVGKGTYKHNLYVIERTKLLEGVYCQSLTFTNSKGSMHLDGSVGTPPQDYNTDEASPPWTSISKIDAEKQYRLNSPIPIRDCEFPSIATVGKMCVDFWENEKGAEGKVLSSSYTPNQQGVVTYSGLQVIDGTGKIRVQTNNVDLSISYTSSLADPVTAIYTIIVGEDKEDNAPSTNAFFRFSYTLRSVNNKFPTKKWTITDCVNRVLELAEPLFVGQKPRFKFNADQAAKYDKILAPEFTMTECNLREQLRIIGGYIHAEPYLNDNMEVEFLPLAVMEKAKVPPYYVHSSASQDVNGYCTEIRTNAKNLVNSLDYAKGVIIDPASNGYRTLRAETSNVRLEQSNAKAITQFPIQEIEKVMCGFAGQTNYPVVDITPYIFEAAEYSILSSYDKSYPTSKSYALYYTRGQKNLDGLFFSPEVSIGVSSWSITNILRTIYEMQGFEASAFETFIETNYPILCFKITYRPIFNTVVSHGKQLYINGETPFAQMYNQSENLVETQYYGEHIKGVAARLGNIEQERTYILKKYTNIPKTGQMIDDYAISAVNVSFMPYYIKITVGLTKDFQRISQYVGINSAKRTYEIAENATYDRNILIKREIVFKRNLSQTTQETHKLLYATGNFITQCKEIFTNQRTYGNISAAYLYFYNKSGDEISRLQLPVVSCALGNVMAFTFACEDNYSAGDGLIVNNGGYWNVPIAYSDYYGRAYQAAFSLNSGFIGNYSPSDLPKTSQSIDTVKEANSMISTNSNYLCRKDNKEKLSFTVEYEFKTTEEDLIIGSALAAYHGAVLPQGAKKNVVLYWITDPNYKLDKFANKLTEIDTEHLTLENAVWEPTIDGLTLTSLGDVQNFNRIYGFIICTELTEETVTVSDEDGNNVEQTIYSGGEILLASNKAHPRNSKPLANIGLFIT